MEKKKKEQKINFKVKRLQRENMKKNWLWKQDIYDNEERGSIKKDEKIKNKNKIEYHGI